jgi:hypothetical protein
MQITSSCLKPSELITKGVTEELKLEDVNI